MINWRLRLSTLTIYNSNFCPRENSKEKASHYLIDESRVSISFNAYDRTCQLWFIRIFTNFREIMNGLLDVGLSRCFMLSDKLVEKM